MATSRRSDSSFARCSLTTAVLEAYASNSGYLELTEGSGGVPGRYDRGMLERDFTVASVIPGRHMDGIFQKHDGELVGVLDWMEANPEDGRPWIGLLLIRASRQRGGLASEAFQGFAQQLRDSGRSVMRAGVVARNAPGRAFAERLGFEVVSTKLLRMPAEEEVVVLERTL